MLVPTARIPKVVAEKIATWGELDGEEVWVRRGIEARFRVFRLRGDAHFGSLGTLYARTPMSQFFPVFGPLEVFEIRDLNDNLIARNRRFCSHCFTPTVRVKYYKSNKKLFGRDDTVYGCVGCGREWTVCKAARGLLRDAVL